MMTLRENAMAIYNRQQPDYYFDLTIYTDAAFQIWKAQTENARNRYVNGELTYEELDALTQLPKKKGE